jgi:PPIC-type PPIASE domain
MKIYLGLAFLTLSVAPIRAQQPASPAATAPPPATIQQQAPPTTIRQIKEELEKSPNPLLYTKQVLKRRFKIDTITVTRTRNFGGLADSLAYHGTEKKVYGPYGPKGSQFLVQLLSKAPNQFYHISQIFIDTSVFSRRIADSIGSLIIRKLQNGTATFGQLAMTYTIGGSTQGDLGWIARGALYPTIEHEVIVHKKGEVFKIWSKAGLSVIRKEDDPRQDTGFALMMQVFL